MKHRNVTDPEIERGIKDALRDAPVWKGFTPGIQEKAARMNQPVSTSRTDQHPHGETLQDKVGNSKLYKLLKD